MVGNTLHVAFDGPRVNEVGVTFADFYKTIQHLQTALRNMVIDLANISGRPPDWVRQESILRLRNTFPGSLGAELLLAPEPDSQGSLENYGQLAIDRIVSWKPEDTEGPGLLPQPVADALYRIYSEISSEITTVTISNPDTGHSLLVPRIEGAMPAGGQLQSGPLYGWLNEVNWERRTAQLHRYGERYVPLRFGIDFHDDMLQLATQYVEVRGRGHLNRKDEWTSVQVEQVTLASTWNDPFDLETFMNNPSPKLFDPEEVVRASEPFDVDEFVRIIREGRDV